jgi:hypothetical protein
VLGTCELIGINPIEYLADILPRLARGIVVARDIPAMTPAAWKRAQGKPSANSKKQRSNPRRMCRYDRLLQDNFGGAARTTSMRRLLQPPTMGP